MSTRFWHLTYPDSVRNRADWDESMHYEGSICPAKEGHRTSGERIGDLRIELASPRAAEFVWTWGSECLILDTVLKELTDAGFTGFEVRPVEVTGIGRVRRDQLEAVRRELPRLWELVVTGWAGEAADETGIRLKYYCEGCHRMDYTGGKNPAKLIDPAQWDGSDFVVVWPLPLFIFVTDRVATFLRERHYRGYKLVPLEDLDLDPYAGESYSGFSPGWPPPGRRARGPEAFPEAEVLRWPKWTGASRFRGWLRDWATKWELHNLRPPLSARARAEALQGLQAKLPPDYLELLDQTDGLRVGCCETHGTAAIWEFVSEVHQRDFYILSSIEECRTPGPFPRRIIPRKMIGVVKGSQDGVLHYLDKRDEEQPRPVGESLRAAIEHELAPMRVGKTL